MDIPNEIEDVDKAKEEKEEVYLKEEVEAASTGRLNKKNWLTNSFNNGNLRPRFDISKVKCYNCQKVRHYVRDCWNSTRRIEKNANLVVEKDKKAIILLVHDE